MNSGSARATWEWGYKVRGLSIEFTDAAWIPFVLGASGKESYDGIHSLFTK